MHLILVIALAACLTGCSMFRSSPADAPLPKQPDAPTTPSVVHTLGKDLDKTDHRVAASLVAIEKNADKPKVVVAESRLAQSYLPAPPEADVAFAIARATKADPIDYKKQMEFGRKLATAVTLAWDKLEADQAEAKRVSALKDKRIEELTQEVVRVKQEASNNVWTLAGVACALLGAVSMVFAGPKVGLPLLACGAAIGAFPFVVESEYFPWIAGGFLLVCAGLGIWVVWDMARDKVRDSVNKPNDDVPPQA